VGRERIKKKKSQRRVRRLHSARSPYPDPRTEYVMSPEPVTLERLAELWKDNKGCSHYNLKRRCTKEGWQEKRAKYWERIDREVANRAQKREIEKRDKMIDNARHDHLVAGDFLIKKGYKYLSEGKEAWVTCPLCKGRYMLAQSADAQMRPSDGRAMIKDGVEIQRKGLGLDEAKVNVFMLGEMAQDFVRIIQKHLDSPDDLQTYKAIRRDIIDMVKSAKDEVDEMERVSYVPAGTRGDKK